MWTAQTFDNEWPWTITGAPRVFDGMVVVGNGGADLGVRGFVSAWDADTGKFLWKFYLVPGDPAKGPGWRSIGQRHGHGREDLDRRVVETGRRRHCLGFHRL